MSVLEIPRTILANGAILMLQDELLKLGIKKPLLISDRGLVAAGIVTKATSLFTTEFEIFTEVSENPIFEDVDSATEKYRNAGCDGVIALGGGSVIDTAKLVAVLGGHPGRAAEYVGFSHLITSAVAPLIAIPTTAGTGSEASPDAGIHPDATSPSSGVSSRYVIPALAILDPELALTLPPRLTAATGIDALSHCIEGYLAEPASPFVDALALDGISRVARFLERATVNGQDREARWQMTVAAYAGGVAISKGLGPAHALAITCSDQGFHHGILSNIGLLATLDMAARYAADKMSAIARAMGLPDGQTVREGVLELGKRIGLPASLAQINYVAEDIVTLGKRAHLSHFNATSCYHPSADEYAAAITRLMNT